MPTAAAMFPVTVEWVGPADDLAKLLSALAPLNPVVMGDTPNIALNVEAPTPDNARSFVRGALIREHLTAMARVLD